MTLVVEDGTGIATADSLASLAEADTYHAERDNQTWFDFSLAKKEGNLRAGTDYVCYSFDWKGWLTYPDVQALAFPRTGIVDHEGRTIPSNIVPERVKQAVIYLAWQAETQALQPSTSASAAGIKRKKVASLELEFFEGGGTTVKREFPEINTLLHGLHTGTVSGISGSLIRWS